MKKILFYIQLHLSEHWEYGWRGVVFLVGFPIFVFACLLYNFATDFDIYFQDSSFQWWGKAFFYAFPFFTVTLSYVFLLKKQAILKKPDFWLLSLLIVLVLFLNQYISLFDTNRFDSALRYFFKKLFFNVDCCIFYLLLPLGYWFLVHRKSHPEFHFYGLSSKGFDYQTYLFMLLVMLPLLYGVSFRADFLEMYPRYKAGMAEHFWGISPFWTVSTYELSYSLQFVCLEIFFRGFIVMALAKYLGSGAIWVMVAVYVFIHFNKPMFEAIGSFFGGYILGVIAYYSRSIYGGMFIHIGVALLMELFAFLQG